MSRYKVYKIRQYLEIELIVSLTYYFAQNLSNISSLPNALAGFEFV